MRCVSGGVEGGPLFRSEGEGLILTACPSSCRAHDDGDVTGQLGSPGTLKPFLGLLDTY